MPQFSNPAKSTIYFQPYQGALPLRLPTQSVVTAPSGKGFSWQTDYGGGKYRASRLTSDQSRVTFNVQIRRDNVSPTRNAVGDGKTPLNVIVLESDTVDNPDFTNFTVGAVFFDCGLTGRSTSQSMASTDNTGDPKQYDIFQFSAADWIEIRPLQQRRYLPTAFSATADFSAMAYSPTASTNRGLSELTVVGGVDGTAPALYYALDKGTGTWVAMTTTGLQPVSTINAIEIIGNRIIVGTTKGIYNADLTQLGSGSFNWYLSNGTTTSDNINDLHSPTPGMILATTTLANGEYLYSLDQGFSFTRVSSVSTARQWFKIAGISDNLLWVGTLNQVIFRLISPLKYTLISGLNPDGTPITAGDDILSIVVPPNRPQELYLGVTDGRILHSRNAGATTPTFEVIYYPGVGSSTPFTVTLMKFSPDGTTMWFTIKDSVNTPYLLVDYSGGYAGSSVAIPYLISGFQGMADLIVHSSTFAVGVNVDQFLYFFE